MYHEIPSHKAAAYNLMRILLSAAYALQGIQWRVRLSLLRSSSDLLLIVCTEICHVSAYYLQLLLLLAAHCEQSPICCRRQRWGGASDTRCGLQPEDWLCGGRSSHLQAMNMCLAFRSALLHLYTLTARLTYTYADQL
jgi:hypothetical protein